MDKPKWDSHDLEMLYRAEQASLRSPDPSMKCGSIIVKNGHIAGTGWNDMPRGCSQDMDIWNNRPLKYERVVHGEVAAVIDAGDHAHGSVMYCWPPGVGPSCSRCTAVIIQAGIRRVYFVDAGQSSERWADSVKEGLKMYDEAGVEVVGVPLPEYNAYHQDAHEASYGR